MSSIRSEDPVNERGARIVPTARAAARAFGVCAASIVLAAALAEPVAAGHGAVSYENPMKAAERKKREKQAVTGQPATTTAPAAPATAAPATAASAAARGVDRDHVFATTARRQLADVVEIAQDEIASGTDPQLEAAARRILETLRKEIAELDQWLAAHPQPASTK